MPTYWRGFIQHIKLLVVNSSALRNSKLLSPEALLQLSLGVHKVLSHGSKTSLQKDYRVGMASGFLTYSDGQCNGDACSAVWLPLDLFFEDASDGSLVMATSAVEDLSGCIKSLQALNGTTWHDTFLGLWFADIIEEEEVALMDEAERSISIQWNETQSAGQRRKDLVSSLQILGDYEGLLTPPPSVIPVANQATAKAMMSVSGLTVGSGYFDCISMSDLPMNCSGNLRHLIVEACISRNLLDTTAYLWPGYVNGRINQIPHSMPGQVPGWSSLMKGAPLTPSMVNALVSTPASRNTLSILLQNCCRHQFPRSILGVIAI